MSSLCKTGCHHFHDFLKKAFSFDAPDPLKELPKEVATRAKRYIWDFWDKYGHAVGTPVDLLKLKAHMFVF